MYSVHLNLQCSTPTSLFMENFKDGTLKEYYAKRVFEEQEAWNVLLQCSKGLLELGMKKIIHRDLTPSNILVQTKLNGVLNFVISDLGNAIEIGEPCPMMPGTQAFAAPETLNAIPTVSRRSDVFSLAMIVVSLLRRGLPYDLEWDNLAVGETHEQRTAKFARIYRTKGELKPKDMVTLFPPPSPSLIYFLQQMLALNPEKRIPIQRVVSIASDPDQFVSYIEKLQIDNAAQQRYATGLQATNATLKLDLSKAESERDSTLVQNSKLNVQLATVKIELAKSEQLERTSRDDFLQSEHSRLFTDGRVTALTDKVADATSEREAAISERDRAVSAQTEKDIMLGEKEKRIFDLERSLRQKDEELSQQHLELLALRNALSHSASLAASDVYFKLCYILVVFPYSIFGDTFLHSDLHCKIYVHYKVIVCVCVC